MRTGFIGEERSELPELVRLNVISDDESRELDEAKENWNCADGIRPCPFFCRYNLQYDVSSLGSIKVYKEVQGSNCAWDHITPEGMTVKDVAKVTGMHRQRIDQIESSGLRKAAKLKNNVDFLPERRSIGAQCEDAAFFEQRDNPDFRR